MAPSLGVIFRPQFPPEDLLPVARAADEAGLDELWLWEDCFSESGLAAAAAVLGATTRLRVAIGVMPVPLRNVALLAMEVATLCRMFPGRFEVGLGHGVQSWMGQVGAREDSPMTLLREYTDALRALLAGDEVTVSGRYVQLDRVRLDWPPSTPPRLLLGAVKPRTTALAGSSGDGFVATGGTSPDALRDMRALAAEAAGGREPYVAAFVLASTGPGADERYARELAHWQLPPDSDVGAVGDASAVADVVRRYAGAGADTVALQPSADEPDLIGFVRFAAQQVAPLLRGAQGSADAPGPAAPR